MTAGPKEIWRTFKQDMKEGNAKLKSDYKADMANIKSSHQREVKEGKPISSKKGWTALGLVLTIPLFIFGIILLIVGVMIIGSIF